MAHECPICGMTCHCGTDIDDILLNDELDIADCTHCPDDERDEEDDDRPDYDIYGFDD